MFKRKLMLGTTAGLIGALAIAGAAFADTGSTDGNPRDSIKDRVAEILGIERESLDSAMSTAREEHREAKQDERLATLVENGVITLEQADEIDAWEDARPEVMDKLKRFKKNHQPGQMPPVAEEDRNIESRLAALVEQEVITQEEADAVVTWIDAKPDYLDDLREELRGERDGRPQRRHPHSRHHRGGNGQHGPQRGFGQQGEVVPDSGTGTSFTFPDGSEVNL